MTTSQFAPSPIPARAGVGLKPEHYQTILNTNPNLGWFEVIPENYMGEGGAVHRYLEEIRSRYPLSMHSIGLSLGSEEGVSIDHLKNIKKLIDRYQPALVSEHLSWSSFNAIALNDLLPVPYTDQALNCMVKNIDQTQTILQRQILLENPSSYFQFDYSTYSESEFLVNLALKSGAGILLDINNIFVSATNHGFDAYQYIDNVPAELVQEIHLAGHSVQQMTHGTVLIDDHGSEVINEVWHLYEYALNKIGNRPTLIEWDSNIPKWDILYNQAMLADNIMTDKFAISA